MVQSEKASVTLPVGVGTNSDPVVLLTPVAVRDGLLSGTNAQLMEYDLRHDFLRGAAYVPTMNTGATELFAILIPIFVVLLIIAFVIWRNQDRRVVRKVSRAS